MVLDYAKLLNFTNALSFNVMAERSVTQSIYKWMDSVASGITEDYIFFATYGFNDLGFAVNASIKVQFFKEGVWYTCGTYDTNAPITAEQLVCKCEATVPSTTSTKQSQTLNYYVEGYYQEGYYV